MDNETPKAITPFLSYEDARKFMIKTGIRTAEQWRTFCLEGKRPANIPSNPLRVYRDSGWKGWGAYLGTDRVRRMQFRSFAAACEFARKSGVKSAEQWKKFAAGRMPHLGSFPNDLPSNPQLTYIKDWKNWGHFLGTWASPTLAKVPAAPSSKVTASASPSAASFAA